MNSLDILLYTICTAGALYALWIIIKLIWFGLITLYYNISDEVIYRRKYNEHSFRDKLRRND